jgi:hypothetical protein
MQPAKRRWIASWGRWLSRHPGRAWRCQTGAKEADATRFRVRQPEGTERPSTLTIITGTTVISRHLASSGVSTYGIIKVMTPKVVCGEARRRG